MPGHDPAAQATPVGARWLLYFHTIRYLRPVQIFWRIWRKLATPAVAESGPAPERRLPACRFEEVPRKPRSMLAGDTFRFMNREAQIRGAADWNDPRAEALWLYNLHYFDDLCAAGAEARRAWHESLIARWIAENPPGHGVGWDAYPLSLRVVNWIKWELAGGAVQLRPAGEEKANAGRGLSAPAIQSLAAQVRHLAPRLEWHLLGNHLCANAKALVFAGCFFDGPEARQWLAKGAEILARQLCEQVLADGGHFERSPMYHAIVLEDLLDLINLARCYPGVIPAKFLGALQSSATAMLRWAGAMTHPDGGIAFFNDAALGVAADHAELIGYAERLGLPLAKNGRVSGSGLTPLAESGYIRMQRGEVVVIFDAAPVGPDYLPGHAHADTLSFELSCGVQRVICNSGTSQYGRGAMRLWERSTAAHNTVEIDGHDSSEVWDGFRVARRAYPAELEYSETADRVQVACAHDGYARLPGKPRHRRTIEITAEGIQWRDEIGGTGQHRAVGRIPLHPGVSARRQSDAGWRLVLPTGANLELAVAGQGVTLNAEKGRFSPEFGLTLERVVLVWAVSGTLPYSVMVTLRPITG